MSAVDEGCRSKGGVENGRREVNGTTQLLDRLGHGLVLLSNSSEGAGAGGGGDNGEQLECPSGDDSRNSAAGKEPMSVSGIHFCAECVFLCGYPFFHEYYCKYWSTLATEEVTWAPVVGVRLAQFF